ncbi:MAG: AraC-like DNA-binding protein [Brevundimonas sp.]|jgi:AraC-like DNA-binding protein|uniref:AraC family transcriptional regulator n=1 Tax=Brevundimonas sp. TaxID=1871086 RepID=UPI0039E6F3D2
MPSALTAAIAGVMDRHGIRDGVHVTPVPGLRLVRTHSKVAPRLMTYRASLCVICQGAKEVLAGDRTITYGHMQSLVVTIDIPVLAQIVDASEDAPYVSATLELNPEILLEVATELGDGDSSDRETGSAMAVKDVDSQISGLMIRLVALADQPEAIDILYPGIMREISFWLLSGPTGAEVARTVLPTGQPGRIVQAIRHLRENFEETIHMPDLARAAGMSLSSFHQHFKALTAMSPLQYQKHLRLLEARRRMLTDEEKVGPAALSVGYESISHFTRDYARMFGSPPRKAVEKIKADRLGAAA